VFDEEKFSTVVLISLWKRRIESVYRATNTALDTVCTMMKHFSFEKVQCEIKCTGVPKISSDRKYFLKELREKNIG
jgi:hypothetical protein